LYFPEGKPTRNWKPVGQRKEERGKKRRERKRMGFDEGLLRETNKTNSSFLMNTLDLSRHSKLL
jgi:hypothetical protein